ncbi:MAG: hypothetical protein JWO72_235 [Caulobacteraceae bacterium]|nr:hypothetical protein [Caulobacteraceae bacterium]
MCGLVAVVQHGGEVDPRLTFDDRGLGHSWAVHLRAVM